MKEMREKVRVWKVRKVWRVRLIVDRVPSSSPSGNQYRILNTGFDEVVSTTKSLTVEPTPLSPSNKQAQNCQVDKTYLYSGFLIFSSSPTKSHVPFLRSFSVFFGVLLLLADLFPHSIGKFGDVLIVGKAEVGLSYMDSLCCFNSGNKADRGRSSCSSGKGRSHQCPVKYGFSLVKGKANHPMEDYHVAKLVQFRGHEIGLFAIYDGHLGDSVPAYLQKHLFSNILKDEDFWTDPNRCIVKAYETTDQAILTHSPDLGRGGSTAVTAILLNNQKLWIANVGDSRAVLSRGGLAVQMSTDHEPNNERGSIENRGGFVSNIPGDVARVNGQLAVSRAFGDKNLKLHLRSDPDIQYTDINPDTEFLILASDGLWKVMTNEEAVDIARRIKDPQRAAKQLVTEALNRDSKDDISCIVVRFKG
ncbi:putative protein phosphatase 2C 9 isoform X1 [Senna tora]|uniref:protein-serine/threonine phosphatase n=1 Tax=Senna tora TaxID=362788 RepID=A0A834SGL4_9FABA|nr:putative protein phosphatase 2C 9 isoform X1 [Senna tora]